MNGDQRRGQSGFTLIELLVVLALIVIISVIALPSISSYFQVSLGSATREIASVVKEAYNSTLVTGKVHRLVYDLKNGEYWVEVGPNNALLDTKESKERAERKKRLSNRAEQKSPFSMDKEVTRKKMSLPRGVSFEDLVTEQSPDPITEGVVFTHMFPNGLTEQTLIHLKDTSKHHTSLAITPLLGRTEVFERYASKEDAFGKQ